MENKEKIILDLCGGTGAWSRPYKDAGYDVRVITLPEYDVCTYVPPENVYGILAAPPCTEFSIAKNGSRRRRNLETGMITVEACLKIIWKCRLSGSLKFWALENPVGYLRQFLGKPHFTFYQWWFGDTGIKRTDLWGYFNPPRKTVKVKPEGLTRKYGSRTNGRGWSKPACPPEYEAYISRFHGDAKRAALRAITPPGFAEAFFRANR